MNRLSTLGAMIVATLALAACGGGGSSDPPAAAPSPVPLANDVPMSATATPEAFVSWSAAQAASETSEPLKVDGTTPPTTEEPVTIG